MDVQKLIMEPEQAKILYDSYQQHRAGMTPNDRAIAAIYKRIAMGKLVIRALASITAAGLGPEGLPKLAICRADFIKVQCSPHSDEISLNGVNRQGRVIGHAKDKYFRLKMPGSKWETRSRTADVPLIPVHLRPRKAIAKYHILWEAEWDQYPVDPYLLRRFGEDAWLVVASWDLTPIERAVMSSSLNG